MEKAKRIRKRKNELSPGAAIGQIIDQLHSVREEYRLNVLSSVAGFFNCGLLTASADGTIHEVGAKAEEGSSE